MSEPNIVECPRCQVRLKLKDGLDAAQKFRCPRCPDEFQFETDSAPDEEQPRRTPPATKRGEAKGDAGRRTPVGAAEKDKKEAAVADKPRRKKSRKKKTEQSMRPLYFAIGAVATVSLMVAAGIVYLLVTSLRSADKLIIAKATAFYEAPEETFRCSYPPGWKVRASGSHDHYGVIITSADAEISISQGIVGSVIRDIGQARSGAGQDPDAPLLQAHAFQKQGVAAEIDGYQEEPGVEFVQTRFGRCPRSRFTAASGITRRLRGYRMTVVRVQSQLDVTCSCKETNWETLRPVFDECLASLGPGMGQK